MTALGIVLAWSLQWHAFQLAEWASTEFVILTKPETENDDDKMIFLCTDIEYAFEIQAQVDLCITQC